MKENEQFLVSQFLPKEQTVKVKVKVKSLSPVRLFATPWTVTYQAPPSMGFSRQEYWSGVLFPSPGDLPDPGTWNPNSDFESEVSSILICQILEIRLEWSPPSHGGE